MVRSPALVVAAVLACTAAASAAYGAAGRFTLLVLQDTAEPALLVVERKPAYRMRWIETEASLCGRQRQGSPLHSVHLPASFCRAAVPVSVAGPGDLWLKLPMAPPGFLQRWAAS